MAERDSKNGGVGNEAYYARHYAARAWDFYQPIVAYLVHHSKPGPILDVGCGCGLLVECATQWGLSCAGIDGSDDAIRRAKERCPELDVRQHLLSDRLPFGDASFQTVVLNQVIEHLEPEVVRHTLSECLRVLKSGGLIFVESPCFYNRREREGDPTHINLLRPSELAAMLRESGFARVQPRDSALAPFGTSKLLNLPIRLLFRLSHWERLSASANVTAYKP